MNSRSLAVVPLFLILVFVAGCSGTDPIDTVTEENFQTLITLEDDVRGLLLREQELNVVVRDTRALAGSVDEETVSQVESWYTVAFETLDRNKQLLMSVIDYVSEAEALNHLEVMKSNLPDVPIQIMDPPIGDESFQMMVDDLGVGGLIVFKKGDKAVTIHTAQPNGEEYLVSLEGLEELARRVAGKLR
ncbi:MAG: hypothetical protein IH862_05880 [Chloroflexi bacterium]|nr:hypothetical protein [Chloroflexota bacterium]